jgi:hypothetical protein
LICPPAHKLIVPRLLGTPVAQIDQLRGAIPIYLQRHCRIKYNCLTVDTRRLQQNETALNIAYLAKLKLNCMRVDPKCPSSRPPSKG